MIFIKFELFFNCYFYNYTIRNYIDFNLIQAIKFKISLQTRFDFNCYSFKYISYIHIKYIYNFIDIYLVDFPFLVERKLKTYSIEIEKVFVYTHFQKLARLISLRNCVCAIILFKEK